VKLGKDRLYRRGGGNCIMGNRGIGPLEAGVGKKEGVLGGSVGNIDLQKVQ
jgi:hypothetical protein